MTSLDSGDLRQRSTVQLVKDLTHQANTLVHQELDLVKAELVENEWFKGELSTEVDFAVLSREWGSGGG